MNRRRAGRRMGNGSISRLRRKSTGRSAKCPLRVERCRPSRPAACRVPRSPIARRTASGLPSRRNTGPDSRFVSCRPRGAPPCRSSKARTRPGRRTPGRWLSDIGGAGVIRSLCLTCRPNNIKMFPGFRELAHNHNLVGLDKPVHERQDNETEQVCEPAGDRISRHYRSLWLPEKTCQHNAPPGRKGGTRRGYGTRQHDQTRPGNAVGAASDQRTSSEHGRD